MNKELNKWFYRINNSQEYEVEKLDPRTKRWVKIGKVSGDKRPLTFDVTGLEEGQEYDFRVTAINAEGESEALTTDCAIKAKNPFGRSMHVCMPLAPYMCIVSELQVKFCSSCGARL